MKKTGITFMVLIFSLISTCFAQNPRNSITATYNGINEEGQYEFIAMDDETYYFDEISIDVNIDLDKKEYKGKEFIIEWEETEEEITDDEDEPTGDFIVIKTITYLEEV